MSQMQEIILKLCQKIDIIESAYQYFRVTTKCYKVPSSTRKHTGRVSVVLAASDGV